MSQKSIKGTPKLGATIKNRRKELGLTIEEAATKAGIGTKTWCRYESGESIRNDKAKGVCKALNWRTLSDEDISKEEEFDLGEYLNHDGWSQYLSIQFGEAVAVSFAIGSDIVLDYINEDLREISIMPKGTHIGQLPASMLKDILPEQFLMYYDYNFLFELKTTVINLRRIARFGNDIVARSVLQELAIYLIAEESEFLMETMLPAMMSSGISGLDALEDWPFDLFDDMDIVTWLYSNNYLTKDNIYHFDHWAEEQFYA